MITAAATLVVANSFNLESISMMGSAGFLLIFAAVNGASYRLSVKIGSNKGISIIGSLLCLVALGSLIWLTIRDNPTHILFLAGMVALSVVIEYAYRIIRKREIDVTQNEQS